MIHLPFSLFGWDVLWFYSLGTSLLGVFGIHVGQKTRARSLQLVKQVNREKERADKLANLREQMTLEMTLLTTQKVSKVIDLMEELRRDIPDVKDRIDLEAIEMSGMPDHETVLQAIQEITETAAGADTTTTN